MGKLTTSKPNGSWHRCGYVVRAIATSGARSVTLSPHHGCQRASFRPVR